MTRSPHAQLKQAAILLTVMVLLFSGCEGGKPSWSPGDDQVIRLDSGPIVQRRDGVYRGIPFAAPPVGPGAGNRRNRWLPGPSPVAARPSGRFAPNQTAPAP